MKEFLMLIRENADYGEMTAEQMQDDIEKQIKWVEELMAKGIFKDGNPLNPEGSHIKGNVITDGPYVESKECISGYYFLLANSLEEATEMAKGCPSLALGGSVEIREVIQVEQ